MNMSVDPKIPPYLFSLQQWFASVITRPIDSNNQMNPISPSGRPMSEEAKEFILPNHKLSSDQRIQIYNQQYWWRLLTTLHQTFPMLTRLFGYADFNHSIGMPFLSRYPSHHWSLSQLGEQLPAWIDEYYTGGDKDFILSVTDLDWTYQSIFFAPPAVSFLPTLDVFSQPLALQAHVKLFNFPFDLFSLRKALLKEDVDFWTNADFPVLIREKDYFFLLYRTQNNLISYKELEEGQWTFLHSLSQGLSIEETCEKLEKEGGTAFVEAEASLQLWIPEWINQKYIYSSSDQRKVPQTGHFSMPS